MALARLRKYPSSDQLDPMDEFRIPRWLNCSLEIIMEIELLLLKVGITFPVGGSLLLLAYKPNYEQ